jgi:hypothetical protein
MKVNIGLSNQKSTKIRTWHQDLPISDTGKNRKFSTTKPLIINATCAKTNFSADRKIGNQANQCLVWQE